LSRRFGIVFHHLYTLTTLPIARFAYYLERAGQLQAYLELLVTAFNPATLDGLMCCRLVSVSWNGFLYDCGFNQMLDLRLGNGTPFRWGEWPAAKLARFLTHRDIILDSHCYGCTAGAGTSCGGVLTDSK
jgi:hypothetical protein